MTGLRIQHVSVERLPGRGEAARACCPDAVRTQLARTGRPRFFCAVPFGALIEFTATTRDERAPEG